MQLASLKRSSLQTYTEPLVSTLLPLLVEDPEKLHEIITQFATIWESLYTQIPFELALMTMNAIAPKNPAHDDVIIHATTKNKPARRMYVALHPPHPTPPPQDYVINNIPL